jgi:hypothetical protein
VSGFLAALSAKAAERWLALLAVPGAMLLAFAAATWTVRRAGAWFDTAPVVDAVGDLARGGNSAGELVVLTVLVLVGAAAAGLAAQGLGGLVLRFWFATRLGPVGRRLTARRQAAWLRADAAYREALFRWYHNPLDSAAESNLRLAVRDGMCPVRPERPMWMADRLRAAGERVFVAYGLDLGSLWPRLWLELPDAARAELVAARTRLSDDARLCGWGLLYLAPALWWPPALAVAAATGMVAWRRARISTAVLSDLVESAVDLYADSVATRLGVPTPEGLTRDAGRELTERLRKDA